MVANGALRRLSVLMFTAFVDMMGASILFTQLPFYAKRFGASDLMVGVLISAFFLGQLVTGPLWGRFADQHGRRPAILAGLVLSGVAFSLFAYASSDHALAWLGSHGALGLLLLMRVGQGVGAGTVSVVQAYVSDSTAPAERAKALGWVTAAITTGVLIGPKLGSLAFHFGPTAPGLLAASLCAVNLISAWRWLPETLRPEKAAQKGQPRFSIRASSRALLAQPGSQIATLTWTYALGMLAFFSLNGVIGLFLKDRFQFTEATIGDFFTYIGVVGLVSRAALIGLAVRLVGEVGTLRLGCLAMTTGLFLVPFAHSLPALAVAAIFMPLGTALLFPATTSLSSQHYAEHERGAGLGVQQAFGGTARMLAPLWSTFAYGKNQTLPFFLAGGLMVLVTLYSLRIHRQGKEGVDAREEVGSTG